MSTAIVELRGQIDAKQRELAQIFDEAGPDFNMDNVKSLEGDSAAKVEKIRQLNDELTDLGKKRDEIEQFQGMKDGVTKMGEVERHPGFQNPDNGNGKGRLPEEPPKSIGDLFADSPARTTKNLPVDLPDVNVKSLFQTAGGSITYTGSTAGWYPMDFRSGAFVDYALSRKPLRVVDLIRTSTTNAAAITYIEEQSFTNAAVEVAEGSAKPEAALNVAPVTEFVRKIAVWIPVTDEQLADVSQVRDYLNNRLGFMVRERLDLQVLKGNGTAPNLKGILNRTGLQTAQAKGSDPTPDAIYKEITKIRVNDYSEPNGLVMHPNDWQDVRLLRTADGLYIWGNPSEAGPERIWGLDVVQTPQMTENTALVGDFNQAELATREGITFRVTDSHDDYFVRNITVVLVEMRAALLVYRPGAFGTVTGV